MEGVRKTIVLVDDISFHLMSVKDRLKTHYKVYPAQNVEILFDVLMRVIPDLILMDLNMPYIDGFEAMEKLKNMKLFANVPVIVLSSSRDKENVLKAMSLGAVDFILKPFSDADLIDSIELQLNPERRAAEKPVILTVDDDPSVLKTVSFLLGSHYKVHTLPSPSKMQKLLNSVTPDLFLLDYNMPGYNGFDLVPVIRSHAGHAETPIVYLTTERSEDKISTAIHLGACGFILKPVDGDILREKLALHLKDFIIRRRMRRF
ncbi:MAG: response regulator [Oscillospiraceae bacterium]|nr:response regulator [Oscillospiraceae bacterium]